MRAWDTRSWKAPYGTYLGIEVDDALEISEQTERDITKGLLLISDQSLSHARCTERRWLASHT